MNLKWFGQMEGDKNIFPASVPGNIQKDYADFMGWGDINYGNNCKEYLDIEDAVWFYHTSFDNERKNDEKIFFVSKGIDYEYDVILNDNIILHHEGLYTPIEIDITDKTYEKNNTLSVKIYSHPKRKDASVSRSQADECVKPPVGYGWDWHPRVIPSGIWNDTYIEYRGADYISNLNVTSDLSDDFDEGTLKFDFECEGEYLIKVFEPEGLLVYSGSKKIIKIENPLLWWCNGQGKQSLYYWEITTSNDKKIGKTGFRKIELTMESLHWQEPYDFPKSRSNPPTLIKLNGRKIFAKGSNFVSPEIFPGVSGKNTYVPLVTLAKEANMNIFRMWGGSGVQKDIFFELCDEAGIMVWQEFPLACNNYRNNSHYLEILEQEAIAIVKNLRQHCSVILWCGGNELFNGWSKMTDQSYALRLLNKVCYEYDRNTPFISTSPLAGMAHGCYLFYHEGKEVYQMFNESHYTAYTEFGVPSVSEEEYLKTFIPENEYFPPKVNTAWETHHSFKAWGKNSWMCMDILEKYFGTMKSVAQIVDCSNWLQCEGYKAIFEEARRKKPYCSMAISWCYNEPWKTAANNSILNYPAVPKRAYFDIKNSLNNIIPSARINKFSYESGELFSAELWILNDSYESIERECISVYIEIGGNRIKIFEWHVDECQENTNIQGHIIQYVLPKVEEIDSFTLILESEFSGNNSYKLHYKYKPDAIAPKVPVLNM